MVRPARVFGGVGAAWNRTDATGGVPLARPAYIYITCCVQVWFCLRPSAGLGWCRVGFVLPLFENVFSGRRVFQDGHRSHLCRLDAARSCRCMIVYPRFRVSSSLTVQRVGVCGGFGCGVDCIRGVVQNSRCSLIAAFIPADPGDRSLGVSAGGRIGRLLVFSVMAQRSFLSVGWSVRRGFPSVCFHCPPPASPSHFHPDALRLVPGSVAKMYVWILLYPSSFPILAAAA